MKVPMRVTSVAIGIGEEVKVIVLTEKNRMATDTSTVIRPSMHIANEGSPLNICLSGCELRMRELGKGRLNETTG